MMSLSLEKSKLLLAEPSILSDDCFNRAVVLLTDLNKNGTVGFIFNKPYEFSLNDLLPEIQAEFCIYNGGPVEQENLYFIHNVPHLLPGSVEIANGLYWGGNFDQIILLINDGKITKHNIRFFLGYSGWKENQLQHEIQNNLWILLDNPYMSDLLSVKSKDLWKRQLNLLGGDYTIWSNAPSNPTYN